jgi:hypothetical protein
MIEEAVRWGHLTALLVPKHAIYGRDYDGGENVIEDAVRWGHLTALLILQSEDTLWHI